MGCLIMLFSTLLKRLTDNLITAFQCKPCLTVFFSNPVYFVLCISNLIVRRGLQPSEDCPKVHVQGNGKGSTPSALQFLNLALLLVSALQWGKSYSVLPSWWEMPRTGFKSGWWRIKSHPGVQANKVSIRNQLSWDWSPGHAALGSFFLGFFDRTPSTPSPSRQKQASCLPLQWCFCRKSVAAVLGQTLVSYV